jgi:hypothetical protein
MYWGIPFVFGGVDVGGKVVEGKTGLGKRTRKR